MGINWSWEVTTPPVSEPLSLTDAKAHLRVTDTAEDALITAYIVAARKWIEQYTHRSIPSQVLTARFDQFPYDSYDILLPQSPAQSITSINYIDTEGNSQLWASDQYTLDAASVPARLSPEYNVTWPSTRQVNNAVTVVYTAGYTTVPEDIVHALKLIVGSMYSIREGECPQQTYTPDMGVRRLLANYRVHYRGPWV